MKSALALSKEPAAPPSALANFGKTIATWQIAHGRQTLPWQNTRDPYRVWLSEIMLQQTQVSTVLDYFTRFLARFPDVQTLADAEADDVLALWSGLGYYSRARHLHACAKRVVELHGGAFPLTSEQLQTLPGIGPSTAAAIASICFLERVAILDGNVKRVLTRVLAFSQDLATASAERELWRLAHQLVPEHALMPAYTQGLMDLGASLCSLRQPQCAACPVQQVCKAFDDGNPTSYPVKTRKLKRSAQGLWLLRAQSPNGAVWLERRPSPGIWGGLYCLPAFASEEDLLLALPEAAKAVCIEPAFMHVLTHKDLYLTPVAVKFNSQHPPLREPGAGAWFLPGSWTALGLPAPIRKLLTALAPQG
jgi:A/G-specific adenine glycosylase